MEAELLSAEWMNLVSPPIFFFFPFLFFARKIGNFLERAIRDTRFGI